MAHRLAAKLSYGFDLREVKPLVEFFMLFTEEDILRFFPQKGMVEGRAKKQHAAEIIAEAKGRENEGIMTAGDQKERETQQTYILTYYNPELDAVEKLATVSNIKIKDEVQKKIEESVGMHSGYPVYSLVTAPLMITVVDQNVLQKILDEREYGTPPLFHGPVKVKIGVGESKSSIVVVARQKKAKEALIETLQRKEKAEAKIGEEIVIMETAIKALRKNEVRALERLPPLTRARFLEAYEKKKLSKAALMILLKRDISFLKEIKKKLQALSLEELIKLVNTMKSLHDETRE